MGVFTYSQEFPLAVAPSRIFKAMILESHNLAHKISPQEIKSVELVQGDGGVGSIKKTNFVEGLPIKYVTHKMDAWDVANNSCKFTMIGGEPLDNDKIEFIVNEVKYEASGNGTICKMVSHFHTKGDYVPQEDKIKEGDAKKLAVHKAAEAYLIANPDVCA